MAITEERYADISADGLSDWVKAEKVGVAIIVDSVDGSGDSASWGAASAALMFSLDGQMETAVSEDGTDVSGTDGYCRIANAAGYYAIRGSSISGETLRIRVQHPVEPFRT